MRIPWGPMAVFIFLAMIWCLIPDGGVRGQLVTVRNNVKPADMMTIKDASEEIENIKREINDNWGQYDGAMAYRHMNRLFYISVHFPPQPSTRDAFWERVATRLSQTRAYSSNARRDQTNHNQVRAKFARLRDADDKSWFNFSPTTTSYDFKPLFAYWSRAYNTTVCFAFLLFVCLLMREELLWMELRRFFIFRLSILSLVWPVAIWFYPSQDLVRGVRGGALNG